MKRYTLLFVLISTVCFSQKKSEFTLDSILTKEDAKSYLKNNKTAKGKVVSFNTLKHKTKLASELFNLSVGSQKSYKSENGKTVYKVLEKSEVPHYKASIIEFDINETPLSEINSLRAFILKGINSGQHKFENLARVYSKHPSGRTGGDLGWVKEGTFPPKFEKAINSGKIGKPFIYDEYRKRKHYILLKTEPKTTIEEITVLKITQDK